MLNNNNNNNNNNNVIRTQLAVLCSVLAAHIVALFRSVFEHHRQCSRNKMQMCQKLCTLTFTFEQWHSTEGRIHQCHTNSHSSAFSLFMSVFIFNYTFHPSGLDRQLMWWMSSGGEWLCMSRCPSRRKREGIKNKWCTYRLSRNVGS